MFQLFQDHEDSTKQKGSNTYMRFNSLMIIILFFVGASIARRVLRNSLPIEDAASKITLHNSVDRCVFLFGILTVPRNKELRDWARTHWIPQLPSDACHVFLYDLPEDVPDSEKWDAFVMDNKHKGRAVKFGEKLYNYYSKALLKFPNVKYFIKMDDDAVICTDKLFQHYKSHPPDERTYSGWFHVLTPTADGFHDGLKSIGCNRLKGLPCIVWHFTRSDEFFVLVGRELAEEIASKPLCDAENRMWCETNGQWFDTNFGGTSLGLWLSMLEDVHVRVLNNFIQFDMEEKFTQRGPDMMVYHPRKTVQEASTAWDLCESAFTRPEDHHSLFRCNRGDCKNYFTTLDFLSSKAL